MISHKFLFLFVLIFNRLNEISVQNVSTTENVNKTDEVTTESKDPDTTTVSLTPNLNKTTEEKTTSSEPEVSTNRKVSNSMTSTTSTTSMTSMTSTEPLKEPINLWLVFLAFVLFLILLFFVALIPILLHIKAKNKSKSSSIQTTSGITQPSKTSVKTTKGSQLKSSSLESINTIRSD